MSPEFTGGPECKTGALGHELPPLPGLLPTCTTSGARCLGVFRESHLLPPYICTFHGRGSKAGCTVGVDGTRRRVPQYPTNAFFDLSCYSLRWVKHRWRDATIRRVPLPLGDHKTDLLRLRARHPRERRRGNNTTIEKSALARSAVTYGKGHGALGHGAGDGRLRIASAASWSARRTTARHWCHRYTHRRIPQLSPNTP